MKKFFTLIALIVLCNTAFSQTWIAKRNYGGAPRARSGSFSIPSIHKGYIVAGGNSWYVSDVWAYDTLLNTWTQVMAYPGNDDDPICCSINGMGYASTGGACCPNYTNAIYEYDPVGNTWTAKTPMLGANRTFCVGFVIANKFYVGGGVNNTGTASNCNPLKDFYCYDPSFDTWTKILDCPASGVNAFAAGFAINGKGYVGIGDSVSSDFSGVYTPRKDFWEYDPGMNSWTRKADFPGGPRGGAGAFATCNYGYICCGFTDLTQQQTVNDFWRYDPVHDAWNQLNSFPDVDRDYPSPMVFGNAAFLCNGWSGTNNGTGGTGYIDTVAYPNEVTVWEFIQTVTPGFTTANSSAPSICVGQSVTFNDTSNYTPTNWLWTFPGGTPGTANTQSPTITYNTAGNYDVTLSAWNGCDSASKTYTQYVTVNAAGTLSATANPSTICGGQNSTLSVPAGNATYTWSPAASLNTAVGASVTATPAVTTTYTVVSSGGSCGVGSDSIVVSVLPTPVLVVDDTTVCSGLSVVLNASGAASYLWSPGATLTCTNCQNPSATPTVTTTYKVIGTSGNCNDSANEVVTFSQSVIPGTVTALRDTVCLGTPGNLSLTGNSSNVIQWQSSSVSNTNFVVTGVVDTTKFKTIPLLQTTFFRVMVGSGSCIDSSGPIQIVVPPSLTAVFFSTNSGKQVTFNSSGCLGNVNAYYWDFGDGITSTEADPIHNFTKDTIYSVCLTIYDGSNCSYTFCRDVNLLPNGVITVGAEGSWNIYPNPFGNELYIEGKSATNRMESIEMYDVLGRLVITENAGDAGNTLVQLNVSTLAKGMYYLMIKAADATYVQKVVKAD